MGQRSYKLFINSDLSAELSIFMVQGTASDPGPNRLNSLRRSTMKIGLVGRSRITASLLFFSELAASSHLRSMVVLVH